MLLFLFKEEPKYSNSFSITPPALPGDSARQFWLRTDTPLLKKEWLLFLTKKVRIPFVFGTTLILGLKSVGERDHTAIRGGSQVRNDSWRRYFGHETNVSSTLQSIWILYLSHSWHIRRKWSKLSVVFSGTISLDLFYASPTSRRCHRSEFSHCAAVHCWFTVLTQVLLLGQYSVGKTTFVEYLLHRTFPGASQSIDPFRGVISNLVLQVLELDLNPQLIALRHLCTPMKVRTISAWTHSL
jgi:hypothetical protein